MENKNPIEEFDKLFQAKFEEASSMAPDGLWEDISSQVNGGSIASTSAYTSVLIKGVAAVLVTCTVVYGIYKSVYDKEKRVIDSNDITAVDDLLTPVPLNKEALELEKEKFIHSSEEGKEDFASNKVLIKSKTAEYVLNNKKEKEGLIKDEEVIVTDKEKDQKVTDSKEVIEPFNLGVKDVYCYGERLQLSINGTGVDVFTWKVNGKLASKGKELDYKLNEAGVLTVQLFMNNTLIGVGNTLIDKPSVSIAEVKNADGIIELRTNTSNGIWYTNNRIEAVQNGTIKIVNTTNELIPFTLVSKSAHGCVDSIKTNLENKFVLNGGKVIIPDGFIPGGDNYNDKFTIKIENESYYNLKIFDLKSQLIFESNNKNEQWDGKCFGQPCNKGNYVYILNYKLQGSEKVHVKKGRVVLFDEKY